MDSDPESSPGNITIQITQTTAAPRDHVRSLAMKSATGEIRPIHQHMNERPNNSPTVGTTYSGFSTARR